MELFTNRNFLRLYEDDHLFVQELDIEVSEVKDLIVQWFEKGL